MTFCDLRRHQLLRPPPVRGHLPAREMSPWMAHISEGCHRDAQADNGATIGFEADFWGPQAISSGGVDSSVCMAGGCKSP